MCNSNETDYSQLESLEDDITVTITVLEAISKSLPAPDNTNESTQTNQNLQNQLDEIKVKIHSMIEILAYASNENITSIYKHISHKANEIESNYPNFKDCVKKLDFHLEHLQSIRKIKQSN